LVLSVPTQSIRECLNNVQFQKNDKIIVNTAKGIEKSTHQLPYKIVQEVLSTKVDYYTLVGPSFAEEVEKKMPTLVNFGYLKKSKKTI
jgi:glycerol-3-phosphate dehydrogenase